MELSYMAVAVDEEEDNISEVFSLKFEPMRVDKCDKENNNSMLTPQTPQFFKIILEDTIQDKKLGIPRKFVKKYGNGLSNSVLLTVPSGDTWHVELTKSDGVVWLQNGWQELVEFYSLKNGYFLVFKYEGNGKFLLLIFDMSASEIEYPCKSHIEDHKSGEQVCLKPVMEAAKDVTCGEITQNTPPRKETMTKKSRASSSKSRKKRKTDENDCEDLSNCEEDLQTEVPGDARAFGASELYAKARLRASTFKSEKPFFLVTMQPSFINPGRKMCIPKDFTLKFLKEKVGDLTLCTSDGKTWCANYHRYISKNKYTKAIIHIGWKPFVQDNNLEAGDVCVFELISQTKIKLKVIIYRVCHDTSSSSPLDGINSLEDGGNVSSSTLGSTKRTRNGLKRPMTQIEKAIAIQRTDFFQSKNPFFKVVMQPRYLTIRRGLSVPHKFVKRYLDEEKDEAILQVADGRTWIVKFAVKVVTVDNIKLNSLLGRLLQRTITCGRLAVLDDDEEDDNIRKISTSKTQRSSVLKSQVAYRRSIFGMTLKENTNSMFTPKTPHFFKIILEDTIQDKKLGIPRKFVKKYGNGLSNSVLLTVPSGDTWHVELTKSDGVVWLQNGWQELVEFYSLKNGYFLVFKYEGIGKFLLLIFDMSASEIEYPCKSHIEDHKSGEQLCLKPVKEEAKDVTCGEITQKTPPSKEPRKKRSQVSCSKPRKKQKTNKKDKDENICEDLLNAEEDINTVVSGDALAFRAKEDSCDELLHETPPCKETRKKKSPASSSKPRKKRKTDENDCEDLSNCEEDLQTKVTGDALAFGASELYAKARLRASSFKSENPFFLVTMQPSYINPGRKMCIPKDFTLKFLKEKVGDLTLCTSDGKTWPANYHRYISRDKYTKAIIHIGWKPFMQDNNLEAGDVCVFELISQTEIKLKVIIYRVCHDTSSSSPLDGINSLEDGGNVSSSTPGSTKPKQNGLKRPMTHNEKAIAIERTGSFKSKNPFFKVVMQPRYLTIRCSLSVPYKFVKRYLDEEKDEAILQVADGRTWIVKFAVKVVTGGQHKAEFSSWRSFAKDNNLEVGDVCVFELINRHENSFKVSIFSAAPGANPSQSLQADDANAGQLASKNCTVPRTEADDDFDNFSAGTSSFGAQHTTVGCQETQEEVNPSDDAKASQVASKSCLVPRIEDDDDVGNCSAENSSPAAQLTTKGDASTEALEAAFQDPSSTLVGYQENQEEVNPTNDAKAGQGAYKDCLVPKIEDNGDFGNCSTRNSSPTAQLTTIGYQENQGEANPTDDARANQIASNGCLIPKMEADGDFGNCSSGNSSPAAQLTTTGYRENQGQVNPTDGAKAGQVASNGCLLPKIEAYGDSGNCSAGNSSPATQLTTTGYQENQGQVNPTDDAKGSQAASNGCLLPKIEAYGDSGNCSAGNSSPATQLTTAGYQENQEQVNPTVDARASQVSSKDCLVPKTEAAADVGNRYAAISTRPRDPEAERTKGKLHRSQTSGTLKALQRACGFKSQNPFFTITMQPSYVCNEYRLPIPLHFSRKYLTNWSGDVILCVPPNGKTWPTKYHREATETNPRAKLIDGWKTFVEDNNLEIGDVCVCEMHDLKGYELLLNVVIYKAETDEP
ncbi:hypothetical protein V6N13_044790 [Hibiscus sabdariffa]|uniref:TF-B3 domain-containing protein n=1 Tax=Hibiscus sabdariffa TaxID=183260 RepID=A0ABR2RJ76_9ROSI